jgi:hypothetical protein
MMHWWGKNQVAEKCRSAILTTYETDLRTSYFHAGKTAGDNRRIIDSGREDESDFRPTHLVLKEVDVRSREL